MIFGIATPKFIYNHGLAGEVEVFMGFAKIESMEPRTEFVENRSELTGDRDLIKRGTHWTVRLRMHLFKEADAQEKYLIMNSYKGLDVSLWLHSDGEPFRTTGLAEAVFTISEVTPFYMTTTDYKDGLIVEFQSKSVIVTPSPDMFLIVMKSFPGQGRQMYFPFTMANEDFFLMSIGQDGSLVFITQRDLEKFTMTGAMDQGRVTSVLATTGLNVAGGKIRVGRVTNLIDTGDTTVSLPSDGFPSSSYVVIPISSTGALVTTSDHGTTNFKMRSTMGTIPSVWYMAVHSTISDLGKTKIRYNTATVQPGGTTVNFTTALPSDDYVLIIIAEDNSLVTAVRSATGFVATSMAADTDITYVAFHKQKHVSP